MDTADHLRDANPWRHEKDPVTLAILGKLAEELGELQAAIGRCIIQGADERHPVTGKLNREWLEEEMVDVKNMLTFIPFTDPKSASERLTRKCGHIKQWLSAIASCSNTKQICPTPIECEAYGCQANAPLKL